MSLITLLVVLALLGLLWWLVTRFGGSWGILATVAKVVIVIVAVYYVLLAFGLWQALMGIGLPHA